MHPAPQESYFFSNEISITPLGGNYIAMANKPRKSSVQTQPNFQLECETLMGGVSQQFPAPKRLLMVNVDPNFLLLIRDYLEFLGYELITTRGRLDALEVLTSPLPDMMIIQADLPETKALQFLSKLQQENPLKSYLPVVFLTDQESLKSDAYFCAPIVPEKLIAVIQSVLSRSPGWAISGNSDFTSQD